MSQKREKRRRAAERDTKRMWYSWHYQCWLDDEPPRWRVLSHLLWRMRKPKWEE